MTVWAVSLTSVFLVSLLSLTGILFLAFNLQKLKKILLFLVSLAAGGLLGGSFFHLLPESDQPILVLAGLLVFFALEKFICWRHCHVPTAGDHPHSLGTMNLIGDGLHNLLDGLLIAASFMTARSLGWATTMAVILHEIPQEIGDFGVLIHAGFSRTKALLFNFASALLAVLGAILALVIGQQVAGFSRTIIPLTAGGFIYIAAADLIPELKKEVSFKKSLVQFLGLALGILIMLGLTVFERG